MIRPFSSEINSAGNLVVGGCDTIELLKEYGSPLYILDLRTVKQMARKYLKVCKLYSDARVTYASKALSVSAIYQILDKEGMFFDVVSDGELYTLLQGGVNAAKAYFHGNNKTEKELELALMSKIGCIVVDNLDELKRIEAVFQKHDYKHKPDILLRIVPELEAHTHEFIRTGQRETKFGTHIENIIELVEYSKTIPQVNFVGLHAHIGSQIFDLDPFPILIEKFVNIATDVFDKTGITLSVFNIGGGIGIKYTEKDDPPDIEEFLKSIVATLESEIKKAKYPLKPQLVMEPGRSIVANAGATLYTVGSVKQIPGGKTYISIDGGMADNPRVITYGAEYSADLANKMEQEKSSLYNVAGKFCESGDILLKDIALPKVETGDALVIYSTGAYNYSMSSNYNRYRKPAMVFVENGRSMLALKRETLSDLVRNDLVLSGV